MKHFPPFEKVLVRSLSLVCRVIIYMQLNTSKNATVISAPEEKNKKELSNDS